MLASPTARATIVRWVTEWYETHIVFRYAGEDAPGEMPQYELGDYQKVLWKIRKLNL